MKIKTGLCFLTLSFYLLTSSLLGQIGIDNTRADSLFNSLQSENLIIGGAAAIMVEGKIVWQNAIGTMDKLKKKAFKLDTKSRTASIAKPITAVAVMQLVDKGLIDLDAPIQTYIPNYPKNSLGEITTRHLLTQTSGIDGYKGRETQTRTNYPTLKDVTEVFKSRKLLFKPGTEYAYTSYGYVLLGLIIESVSDMPYEDYLQSNIFDPAGMQNSGIEIYERAYTDMSSLYHRKRKGKIVDVKKVNNLSNRVPAGGLYSTTEDMIAFGNALLKGTLLSKESLEDMWVDEKVRPIEDGNPYTKGWHIYSTKPPLGRVMGHSGGQLGCSSQLMVLPEVNAVIVIMSNTSASLGEVRNQSIRLINCMKLPQAQKPSAVVGEN